MSENGHLVHSFSNLITNEKKLVIELLIIIILDAVVVIPVYATHTIDKLSGDWAKGLLHGLCLFMFPGVVFFIYILIILATKLKFYEVNKKELTLTIIWIISAFVGLGLLLYSIAIGFFNLSVPISFYVSLVVLSVVIAYSLITVKDWSNVLPLSKWMKIEIIILSIFALPWFFAHVGIYISSILVLNLFFVAEQPSDCSFGVTVHLGDHHGLSGYLFILVSLLVLNKWVVVKKSSKLIYLTVPLISLIQAYGWYLYVEDFTNEQLGRFFSKPLLPTYGEEGTALATLIIVLLALIIWLFNWFMVLKPRKTEMENIH